MKNIFFVLSLSLASSYAYSFETGFYHGESADHQQICDFSFTQNAKSITVHSMECQDLSNGMTSGIDPQELKFGHIEQTSQEQGVQLKADISADSILVIVNELGTTNSMTELFKNSGKDKIHYSLKAMINQTETTFFDLDLIKK